MPRRMISVDEKTYKELVRAKGKLEMETGENLSFGDVIAIFALGLIGGVIAEKIISDLIEEYRKK